MAAFLELRRHHRHDRGLSALRRGTHGAGPGADRALGHPGEPGPRRRLLGDAPADRPAAGHARRDRRLPLRLRGGARHLDLVPPDQFSLVWYRSLLADRKLTPALLESILVGLAAAAVATPVGLSAALAFRAMASRRGAFFLFVLFAMFVPGTIQGLGLS